MDDLLLFGPNRTDIDLIKSKLSARFNMSDLGPCHFYLGIEIIRNRKERIIYLSQQAFVDKILNLFDYQSLNPVATPMEPNLELPKFDSQQDLVLIRRYQAQIGSLLYLTQGTRPDLAFYISKLS